MLWGRGGSRQRPYDLVIADQVSVFCPVVKALSATPVLFYCHFPDLLLSPPRHSALRRAYRWPLDWAEEAAAGTADRVLVNSKYTAGVFCRTFPRLYERGVRPAVLYPGVDAEAAAFTDALSDSDESGGEEGGGGGEDGDAGDTPGGSAGPSPPPSARGAPPGPPPGRRRRTDAGLLGLPDKAVGFFRSRRVLLSIARFERKKRVELVLEALAELFQRSPGSRRDVRVVLAGGWDPRVPESAAYLAELRGAARDLGLRGCVAFVTNFTEENKWAMLRHCEALVYPPAGEHFGIVPVEAMMAGRPVVACNSGGPLETVRQGSRPGGVLCDPQPAAFGAAMARVLAPGEADRMGARAREFVRAKFSRDKFGERLMRHVAALVGPGPGPGS